MVMVRAKITTITISLAKYGLCPGTVSIDDGKVEEEEQRGKPRPLLPRLPETPQISDGIQA